MFSPKLNLEFRHLDELENLGLLEDAIANASERRNSSVHQDDSLSELLSEEANSVMGGLAGRPCIGATCGMRPCEPLLD
jgi:hypothetical protein